MAGLKALMRHLAVAMAILSWGVTSAAYAAWNEAKSRHFTVYSEISVKQLQDFAEKLEKFHFLLKSATGVGDVDPGRPVVVFLLRDPGQLRALTGTNTIAGFYTMSDRNGIAVLARSSAVGDDDLRPQDVLFHEYAHHFLLHYFPGAYPMWFVEGFAEFYSVVKFPKPNVIEYGHIPTYRSYSLTATSLFPLKRLFAKDGGKMVGDDIYRFYATSWLASHYFHHRPDRDKEKRKYLQDFFNGKADVQLDDYFEGGIKAVEQEMRAYASGRILAASLATREMPEFRVTITPVPQDIGGMLPMHLRVMLHPDKKELQALAETVREQAAKYPQSAFAQTVLSEAEWEIENADAALAAADRAIALDPNFARAHSVRAEVLLKRAQDSRLAQDWDAARSSVIKANQLDTEDPVPLSQFYRYNLMRNGTVPAVALEGLIKAYRMLPGQSRYRFDLANAVANKGQYAAAVKLLDAIAFSPHESPAREQAKKLRDEYITAQNGGLAPMPSVSEASAGDVD